MWLDLSRVDIKTTSNQFPVFYVFLLLDIYLLDWKSIPINYRIIFTVSNFCHGHF